jgi:hypothetical protein
MTAASSARPGAGPMTDTRARGTADFTEAKNGFRTSEFYVTVVLIVAALIATYVDSNDTLGHKEGWLFASIIAAAYIISRGLAKLGVREPDREYGADRG